GPDSPQRTSAPPDEAPLDSSAPSERHPPDDHHAATAPYRFSTSANSPLTPSGSGYPPGPRRPISAAPPTRESAPHAQSQPNPHLQSSPTVHPPTPPAPAPHPRPAAPASPAWRPAAR